MANPATVRLHITPLTASTASSLLPADILQSTTPSYHTLPTFPEHPYAFVTLPVKAAEALKKKLHGSTFRGVKVRVEEARPDPSMATEPQVEMTKAALKAERREKRKREAAGEKVKKRKKGEDKDVLEGVQLPEGRKVVRGWTKPEQAAGKKYAGKTPAGGVKKNEEEERGECLFKTPLPPNKADAKKEKKEKEKSDKKKKHKKEVVVKEFKNNTKFPQFLKVATLGESSVENMASEYVDGVGWVNGKGEVVEEEKRKRRAADVVQMELEVREPVRPVEMVQEKATEKVQSTVSFSDDEEMADVEPKKVYVSESESEAEAQAEVEEASESEAESEIEAPKPQKAKSRTKSTIATPITPDTDSSDAESSSKSASPTPSPPSKTTKPTTTTTTTTTLPLTPLTPVPLRTTSKTPTPTLQITIPTLPSPPIPTIHPLEALYKPTAKTTTTTTSTPPSSTFKFGFGATDSDSEPEEPEGQPEPTSAIATPYRERYRSAAPTPDTAIGHRRFFPDEDAFVPSTPKALVGESPLLFMHESRFLSGLSMWSKIPTPKAFTAAADEEEEGGGEGEGERVEKKDKKKGKGKGKNEAAAVEETGAEKTPAEMWTERFYENRGEWNRAWKGRRREVLKAKRKREAAAAGGKRVST